MRNRHPKRHADYIELSHLELDGELTQSETEQLEAHASRCPECRATRDKMASLNSMLGETRIEPHPDLARRVLENLPPAPWELRQPSSWRVAAIAFVVLLTAAYAVSFRGEALGEALPWIATLTAIAELFRSAALAGAGLLAASWSGIGLALSEILARSRVLFVVFGLFVLGVDYLFLRYLWRLSRHEVRAGDGPPGRRGRLR